MKTHVEFRSDQFPPYEDGSDEVNPGVFGKRLAEFLFAGLKSKGFEPLSIIAEDWGYVVNIKNDEFSLWVGCGNYEEYPDGFLCFIEPHKPVIRRLGFLWKIDTSARVSALQEAIDQLLTDNTSIRDKKWWTSEKFGSPSAE